MTYYTRAEIGLTNPVGGYQMGGPVQDLYVHHFGSGIAPPMTVNDAMARIRGAQAYHISKGWGDIGYSFLIDQAGNIYEGRGWFRTGAHTYGWNDDGYGVNWLGDSMFYTPSSAALRAYAEVVRMGIAVGALVPNPSLIADPVHTCAHKDKNPGMTQCCGDIMYLQLDEIRGYIRDLGGGSGPPVQPRPTEEEDMARFTAFRIPNGQIFIEDLQTGMRRDLMAEMPPGATATEGINALQQLINAKIVVGGEGVAYNSLDWNANWLLDQLDDVALDDRVTE